MHGAGRVTVNPGPGAAFRKANKKPEAGNHPRTGTPDQKRTLDHLTFDLPAFPLGQSAPDPEPLVVLQRVLQALGPYLATPADPLRLPGGAALLWEERLRICLRA